MWVDLPIGRIGTNFPKPPPIQVTTGVKCFTRPNEMQLTRRWTAASMPNSLTANIMAGSLNKSAANC